jgi:hypothetical protein
MAPIDVKKICCSSYTSSSFLQTLSDLDPLFAVGAGYVGRSLSAPTIGGAFLLTFTYPQVAQPVPSSR